MYAIYIYIILKTTNETIKVGESNPLEIIIITKNCLYFLLSNNTDEEKQKISTSVCVRDHHRSTDTRI